MLVKDVLALIREQPTLPILAHVKLYADDGAYIKITPAQLRAALKPAKRYDRVLCWVGKGANGESILFVG